MAQWLMLRSAQGLAAVAGSAAVVAVLSAAAAAGWAVVAAAGSQSVAWGDPGDPGWGPGSQEA
jgi:hypothetical protein